MNVRKILETTKFYDGVKASMKLSASQVSRDILELYLDQTEDPKPRNGWGKGEIGSVFHLGMEEIFKQQEEVKERKIRQEVRATAILPNTWTIDGKVDMIDFIDNIIYDWKGMGASAYTEFKKNSKDHKINIQMAVYNWLFGGDFACEAHCFITNWDPVNVAHPAAAYQIVKCDIYTPEEIEKIMVDKTNDLADHLTLKRLPKKCEDVMPRYVSATKSYINSKCEFYCDYAHVCKRKRDDSASKLGLKWGRD